MRRAELIQATTEVQSLLEETEAEVIIKGIFDAARGAGRSISVKRVLHSFRKLTILAEEVGEPARKLFSIFNIEIILEPEYWETLIETITSERREGGAPEGLIFCA